MTPEHRFHSYITAVTVTLMYFVIQNFIPLIKMNPDFDTYLRPLSTILISIGAYKSIAIGLLGISKKFNFVKRHLLGASYLNGTWIGKFKTENLSTIYTVEHFEQTLSSLKIRGQAFLETGELYAQWNSVSENIDEKSGILAYTYNCEITAQRTSSQGVCVFQFERQSESCEPTGLIGYSADLTNGVRTENAEKKHSDNLVPFRAGFQAAKSN